MKQGNKAKQRTSRHLMDICHLKNSELEPKFQKYRGRVVLRGDIARDDSGSHAVVHRARFICVTNDGRKSNGCHSKTTRMRRTSSRCSISSHPGQNGRCIIVFFFLFQSQNVQIFLYTSTKNTNGPNHGPAWKTKSFLLIEICTVIPWNTVGQKFQIGNAYL